MGKKNSMTSETMTKNGKYSSDWKWEEFKQPIFYYYLLILLLLRDQSTLPLIGWSKIRQWNLKKKHLIIWWLKVQLSDHKFIYLLVVGNWNSINNDKNMNGHKILSAKLTL
jgi:hypothetical protein